MNSGFRVESTRGSLVESVHRVSLVALLRAIGDRVPLGFDPARLPESVLRHAELVTVNTRGAVTGSLRSAGHPRFLV